MAYAVGSAASDPSSGFLHLGTVLAVEVLREPGRLRGRVDRSVSRPSRCRTRSRSAPRARPPAWPRRSLVSRPSRCRTRSRSAPRARRPAWPRRSARVSVISVPYSQSKCSASQAACVAASIGSPSVAVPRVAPETTRAATRTRLVAIRRACTEVMSRVFIATPMCRACIRGITAGRAGFASGSARSRRPGYGPCLRASHSPVMRPHHCHGVQEAEVVKMSAKPRHAVPWPRCAKECTRAAEAAGDAGYHGGSASTTFVAAMPGLG